MADVRNFQHALNVFAKCSPYKIVGRYQQCFAYTNNNQGILGMKMQTWTKAVVAVLLLVAGMGDAGAQTQESAGVSIEWHSSPNHPSAAAATPQFIFRCKTRAEFDSYSCLNSLPSPFDASAFDYTIGGFTYFDHVVVNYTFRFTAPDASVTNLSWILQPLTNSFCPGDYQHVDVSLSKTCYSDGVYQGVFLHRVVGLWKIELLAEGVVQWTGYSNVKAGEIHKETGDGATAPVGETLRLQPTFSLRHFDGSYVDISESHFTSSSDIVPFVITGPSRATGMTVDSVTYPDNATSAPIYVTLGSKAGAYSVALASAGFKGATMPSPFSFTAFGHKEPGDNDDKAEGNGDDCGKVADPVTIGLGNSFQQEGDYPRTGLSLLEFTRSYNAFGSKSRLMHNYWNTTFDRFVILPTTAEGPARVRRPDGRTISFNYIAGIYLPQAYFKGSLIKTATGWRYTDVDQSVELFDATGKLLSITDLAGRSLSLTYDSKTSNLTKVTANTGETLAFTYNSYNQLSTMTDIAGHVWTYQYDGYSNLISIARPFGGSKSYYYRDPINPYLLTSTWDGTGAYRSDLYANSDVYWEYDSQGRVTANYFQSYLNMLKRVDITYLPDGSRIVTDSLGRQTTYQTHTINGRGFVDGAIGPGFSSCGLADSQLEYNTNMDVTARTSFGRRVEYGNFDAKGQYGFMIEAAGTLNARRTDFSYDSRFIGKPTSITSPSVSAGNSKATSLTYDALGNVTQQTVSGYRPDGIAVTRTTAYQYAGPLGQLSRVDGPRTDVSDVTQYLYDATTKRLKQVIDADGISARNNLTYNTLGQLIGEDRPNGLKLTYAYIAGTNFLTTLTEVQGTAKRITTWTYTSKRQVETITFSDGINPDNSVQFGYNIAGDLYLIFANGQEQGFVLDSEGNHLRELKGDATVLYPSGTINQWLDRTYDAYNRVDKLINEFGTTDYDYHPDGTLTRVTDGKTQATSYEYDAFKRMTRQIQPGNLVTNFAYDVQDNLVQVTDANQATTRYVIDDLGNRLQLQSPDAGTTGFVYDNAGNLVQSTDAKGQVTTRTYSAGNRLLTVDRVGVSEDETYAYDTCANGLGKLCSITSGNNEYVAYDYDGFGRPSLVVTPAGGIAYSYDAKDNITAITYPSGRRVSYLHNSAGQVTQVTLLDGVRTTVLANNINNLPMGPAISWTYGNGLTEARQFNTQYLPTQLGVAGKFQITIPQYDANGNLLSRTVNGQAEAYTYDALNRLQTASGGFGLRSYQYDAVGNRTQLTADSIVTNSAYQSQSNRIVSDSNGAYSLDPNGNTTSMPGVAGSTYQLGYSPRSQLESVAQGNGLPGSTAVYLHNALGQRTLKSLNGSERRFVYGADGKLLSESLADGSVVEEVVYLNGQPLALLGAPNHPQPPAVDAIVDETAGSFTGNWVSKKATYAYSSKFLQLSLPSTSSNDSFSWNWRPTLSGLYDIWVWWDRKPTDGTLTFYYVDETVVNGIRHSDQMQGTWAYLGRLHLTAGKLALWTNAWQSGNPTAPGAVIDADAARFKLIEEDTGHELDYRYVIDDQLGTPQAVTDKAGTVIWSATYDPFGAATVNPDPDGNGQPFTMNLRFAGQYFDAETGLSDNYFRTYSPNGRYLQSDPTGLSGGVNTFGYVGGNPLVYNDPYGLFNPNKASTSILSGLNSVRLAITGGITTLGAVFASGMGSEDLGALLALKAAWNFRSSDVAMNKSFQFACEAFKQNLSDASFKNFLGLVPFGQNFDDTDEPGPIDWLKSESKKHSALEWISELGTGGT
jgi:RHS repeat-associated protein